jgi:2-hydroxycyclohexanecarboxyl-CoA dehydrogenase
LLEGDGPQTVFDLTGGGTVDLNGRVALVTGAGRGIGAAIARALAAAGAAVAVADLDNAAAAYVADGITDGITDGAAVGITDGTAVGAAVAVPIDVADTVAVAAAVARVSRELGPPDIVVNNAGIDRVQRFTDSDEETWQRLIAVNLVGPIAVCHATVGGMLDRGWGRVINISSDAGKVGSSGEVVYSATKGGVIAFSKALAREIASAGVTVNCVCPGPTDTALLDQVAEFDQRLYDSLARAIPLRRIGRPEDIAPLVVFLAGNEAGYITGQALSVSGGLTMC